MVSLYRTRIIWVASFRKALAVSKPYCTVAMCTRLRRLYKQRVALWFIKWHSGLMVRHLLCIVLLISARGWVIWVQFPAGPVLFFVGEQAWERAGSNDLGMPLLGDKAQEIICIRLYKFLQVNKMTCQPCIGGGCAEKRSMLSVCGATIIG